MMDGANRRIELERVLISKQSSYVFLYFNYKYEYLFAFSSNRSNLRTQLKLILTCVSALGNFATKLFFPIFSRLRKSLFLQIVPLLFRQDHLEYFSTNGGCCSSNGASPLDPVQKKAIKHIDDQALSSKLLSPVYVEQSAIRPFPNDISMVWSLNSFHLWQLLEIQQMIWCVNDSLCNDIFVQLMEPTNSNVFFSPLNLQACIRLQVS